MNPNETRTSHPSSAKLKTLVEFMERNPGMAKGFLKTQNARKRSLRQWEDLSVRLNSLGGTIKTYKQWIKGMHGFLAYMDRTPLLVGSTSEAEGLQHGLRTRALSEPMGTNQRPHKARTLRTATRAKAERGERGVASALSGSQRVDKTESARQLGPAHLAAPARRRWVPPSSLRQAPVGDAQHDGIFRKVRGILNKLTPDKFQKLGDDLLALELDSDKALKGVILLVFEKALDEPKYSSMYAQLCKRLSEEAPNLEPPGRPCTFRLLLLNKCRAEFENRAQAFAAFDDAGPLSPEDRERRHLAKCKMLGNIKFIGELGKLEILAESILHRCIQNLLTRRAAAERQEDLECLAQLVRTCGRVLDSERGRGLMEQYFARMEALAAAPELAPRIRFLLRDVVELRRSGWVPRAAHRADPPVPMRLLRPEEEAPAPRPPPFRRPLDDMLAGLAVAPRRRPARAPPAPRPKRPPATAPLADVQMRPAANSLLFSATRLPRAPPAIAPALPPAPATPPARSTPQDKPAKPKKDKGLSKEEVCRAALLAADREEELAGPHADPERPADPAALAPLADLQPSDKLLRRAVAALLERALSTAPGPGARAALAVARAAKQGPALEPLRALLAAHREHEQLPTLLALAVLQRLAAPADLPALADPAAHHPLALDALRRVLELAGRERTRALLDASRLEPAALVPAGECAAAQAEERGLAELLPALRVRAELARALGAEPGPAALYRWIKNNVEAGVRARPAFVHALVPPLAARVTAEAGSAGAAPPKSALERERALLEAYAPVLRALLAAPDLQLAALYAVQVHAHRLRWPKGLLLRWFMLLYSLEVCDEDAFLRWREDVSAAHPGKGEALFQVNAWLTWLQQQESSDEDADADADG